MTPQQAFEEALVIDVDMARLARVLAQQTKRERQRAFAALTVAAEGHEKLLAVVASQPADRLPWREDFVALLELSQRRRRALQEMVLRGDHTHGAAVTVASLVDLTAEPSAALVRKLQQLAAAGTVGAWLAAHGGG